MRRAKTALKSTVCAALTVTILVAVGGWFAHGTASAQELSGVSAVDPDTKRPLKIEHIETLRFGRVVSDQMIYGTVTVDAETGLKRLAGGAHDFGGFHSRAELRISGEPDSPFVLLLPERIVLQGGYGDAELIDLIASPNGFGRLGPDGHTTVFIGATLVIMPSTRGSFGGNFDILVDYQ